MYKKLISTLLEQHDFQKVVKDHKPQFETLKQFNTYTMNSKMLLPTDDLAVSKIFNFIGVRQAFELQSLSKRTANFSKLIKIPQRINMKDVPFGVQKSKNPKIIHIYIEDHEDYIRFCTDPYFRSVKKIVFGPEFNGSIDGMPSGPEIIIFGDLFDQPTDHLPSTTIMVRYGRNFDHPTDHLPHGTKYVAYGHNFDHPTNNFPDTIEGVEYGYHYNQATNCLPPNTKWLIFGANYDQPSDNFPESLVSVTFGESYDQLTDKLPKNIKNVTFGTKYDQPTNNLPEGLKTLRFGKCFQKTCKNLPIGIKHLTLAKTLYGHYRISDGNSFFAEEENKPPACIKDIIWVNEDYLEEDDVEDNDEDGSEAYIRRYNIDYFKQSEYTYELTHREEHIFSHMGYAINYYMMFGNCIFMNKRESHNYTNSEYIVGFFFPDTQQYFKVNTLLCFPTTCKFAI